MTKQNGKPPEPERNEIQEAIAAEEAIRERADKIWEEAEGTDLTPALFRQLRPLLREPIPQGFIQKVGQVTGKPYESTGIRSAQVQMDRLDNVLGPENWGYKAEYRSDGKLCHVTAWIGDGDPAMHRAPITRDSWGGVNRGSTDGNIWKGSFTNAAKLAFARLGPGWEVYVGAADFDPDTDEDAAAVQEPSAPPVPGIPPESLLMLREKFDLHIGDDPERLKQFKLALGSLGVSARSRDTALASLTPAQAAELDGWFGQFEEVPA